MKIYTKIEYVDSETAEVFTYEQIKNHKYKILQKIINKTYNFIHTTYIIKFIAKQTKLF